MKETKGDNFMLYIPHKKHKNWEEKDEHIYLVFYHKKIVERFLLMLAKKPLKSDIKLDELGSEVWRLADGQRNVFEIGMKLFETFEEKCEPLYDRLIIYLRYLNRRGWIMFENGSQ